MKFINVRGDLFASTFSFGATALIKIVSSMILTRLLYPEAYGVMTILVAIAFTIELLSDIGTVGLVIRSPRGEEPAFLNTMWTLRFLRSCMNTALMFLAAPLIAHLYGSPVLTDALRVYSIWFLFQGLESVSFLLARRQRRVRIVTYSELATHAVSAVFTIVLAHFQNDHFAILYGMILQRILMTSVSYAFYRERRFRWQIEPSARTELFNFAKYVLPSSLLTILLNQYDKVIFLKLFDLQLLGFYGLAANVIGPVSVLVRRNSRSVLYPRCAEYFRRNPQTAGTKYYTENIKLFLLIMFLPAAVAGAAELIIVGLFDPRYAYTAFVLEAFAVRAAIVSLTSTSEDLLVASGNSKVVLLSNVIRVGWIIPASLIGYMWFGFAGFLWGATMANIPVLIYLLRVQYKMNLLTLRYELARIGFIVVVFIAFRLISGPLIDVATYLRAY